MAAHRPSSDLLVFFCNGKKIIERNANPEMSLLTYLRDKLSLSGTKKSCAEGGCGACTVMLSYYDVKEMIVRHLAVNTCLTPLCAVHHMAVTTIEGIGSTRSNLHPAQERIAKAHGSQCGFCTPGFVMSMYTLLRNNPEPSKEDIETALIGNLCRCTGYRPIIEGLQTFSKGGCGKSDCCQNQRYLTAEEENHGLTNKLFRIQDWKPYHPTQDVIFPPELKILAENETKDAIFASPNSTWYCPVTLQGALDLKTSYPEALIVAGNTEAGIGNLRKSHDFVKVICINQIPDLLKLELAEDGIFVGSSVTITDLQLFLKEQISVLKVDDSKMYSALLDLLDHFSGLQIRNMASVGGNLLTDRSTSELETLFKAAGCYLHISNSSATRKVDMSLQQTDTRTLLEQDEILIGITLPFSKENEYIYNFKQSTRNGNDSAILNASMKVQFDKNSIIGKLVLVFGGIPMKTRVAEKTMAKLQGRKWDTSVVDDACVFLLEDLSLPYGSPGGMEKYKKSLALGFFFKFYLQVNDKLTEKFGEAIASIPERWKSFYEHGKREYFQSTQLFQDVVDGQPDIDPVGRPKVFKSSLEQATGEARYIDDIPKAQNELFLALVGIKSPHAKIISIDFTNALLLEGVVDVITADDIPESKSQLRDDVFAKNVTTASYQPIAGVLGINESIARKAAKLIKVDYEELEYILTTEEAMKRNSFHPFDKQILKGGDLNLAFTNCDHVVSGKMRTGMQEHFYMETQSVLVLPGGEHEELEVIASTQEPHETQMIISQVLNIPSNRVVCKTKRLGGGFGGKNMFSCFHAARAAVSAKKVNRPVRAVLERHEDMATSGTRAPLLGFYKIGFNKDGKLQALDIDLYMNAGHIPKICNITLFLAMGNIDNVYMCPNVRVRGHLCKTNLPSMSATRAMGKAQGMAITEAIMDHVGTTLGMCGEKIREINFYKPSDLTHTYLSLRDWTLDRCWELCLLRSDFAVRKIAVDEFNKKHRWVKRGLTITPAKYPIGMFKPFAQGSALVHIYTDGAVLISHGGIEMGQGMFTKMLQIASRTLRIPMEKIHCSETSTNAVPNNTVTHGSVGTDYNGPAVQNACETLLHRLEPYVMKNPKGTWEDWVKAAYFDRINLSAVGYYRTPDEYYTIHPKTNQPLSATYHAYGAAATEVEVDCLTGDHRIIRTDIVMDVGDSLNPAVDIGQIEGAFIQGYGFYVLEDYRYSSSGELLTKGPGGYKIPICTSIPAIFNVSLLHSAPNPRAVFSSKAVGEPPLLLSASVFFAIKEAIASARSDEGLSGFFPLYAPAVPERIRLACQDKFTEKIEDAEDGSYIPYFHRI
ncbi:Xanthine dehydrogenase/oxidase [Holothuria leucospilota]|uniref:Xanthine dehydrogenase/oxidase n=1 Tax=Holothuria leucospilota TaxID=206669 RepID=A0A9Q1HHD0_HOLLE|nr:Xanthine dehydrogenase/oxidase [Holothuria leucospilota]